MNSWVSASACSLQMPRTLCVKTLPAGANCSLTVTTCCMLSPPSLSLSSLASLPLSFRPGVISLFPPHVPFSQTGALGAVLWVMWPSVLQQLSPVLSQKPQVSPQILGTRTLHRGTNCRLKTSPKQQLALTALSLLSSVSAYTLLGLPDTY